ncbi:MAG TPA: hypothetical protein VGL60_10025 [Acidimicrobiales bacterium]|jgi:hypothetical protein
MSDRRGSMHADDERAPRPGMGGRLRRFFLKPPSAAQQARAATPPAPRPVEEVEAANKAADDSERLVGLLAAPLAAAIGLLVIAALIHNDPAARLASGKVNTAHVSPSLYHDLLIMLLVMAGLMLALAWTRKRVYLGVVMALYGLAIFNLHYWGFGVPFLLGGAWLLVRSYRLQQELRTAGGTGPAGRPGANGGRSSSNKRYTPPSAKVRRPARPGNQPKPG